MNCRRQLLALAAAPLLLAAGPLTVRPTNLIVLPPPQTEPALVSNLKPGDILLRQTVSIGPKVELAQDLTVDEGGMPIILPRGTPLATVSMAGGPFSALPQLYATVCAKVALRVHDNPPAPVSMEPFIAGDLEGLSKNLCMIDSDGDNRLDQFVSVDAKGKPSLKAIPPTAFTILPQSASDVPREILIRYGGIGGISNRMSFRALISVNGKLAALLESVAWFKRDVFPQQATLYGARFTLLGYKPAEAAADGRVTVRLDSPIPISQPVILDAGAPTTYYYMP